MSEKTLNNIEESHVKLNWTSKTRWRDKWFDKFEKWDVTGDKWPCPSGCWQSPGPGQTVIWNTNTAGEIQWNRDGTFSVQISPQEDEEYLGEILISMDFLGTFSSASSKWILFILNKVKYRGDKKVNKRESQVGLGEHEEGGEAQVAANIFVQLFWKLIFVRIIFEFISFWKYIHISMMIICFQREALMLCFFYFSETTRVTVIRKVIMMIAVTGGGRDWNKVSSWGSGRKFIGRFIVNINLGATQAETKAVIFHSSSLFMDPPSTASKNTNSYYCSHHTCWEGMVLNSAMVAQSFTQIICPLSYLTVLNRDISSRDFSELILLVFHFINFISWFSAGHLIRW